MERYSSGQTLTSYKYTGQRAEAGLGLYYYGARWYDRIAGAKRHPALGRFIQPDTIVPNPGDAQSFDRYAYVLNNPLRYNDPSGHDPCDNGSKNCDPLWLEYIKGETSCSTGRCGISYQSFLAAKQQYADYKRNPDQYVVDQQILNNDIKGDVEAAKLRISYGMLYASYFVHVQPDIDIHTQAVVELALGGITVVSGNSKDLLDYVTLTRHGQLTNGKYIIDQTAMSPHKTGSLKGGKSQFFSYVDAEKAVLDAAAYADQYNLWVQKGSSSQAKVYVENSPVGVLGSSGETTNWLSITRTNTGFVHGWPASAPQ